MKGRKITDVKDSQRIPNSDILWNICCYEYLQQIFEQVTQAHLKKYPEIFKDAEKLLTPYSTKIPYGDLYTEFLQSLESQLMEYWEEDIADLDGVVELVYLNDNQALERASGMIMDICTGPVSQTDKEFKKLIRERMDLAKHQKQLNNVTPFMAGGNVERLLTVIGYRYNPEAKTSMPSIRRYKFHKYLRKMLERDGKRLSTEIRQGTPGRREASFFKAHMSFTYRRWLDIEARRTKNPEKISHIFFHMMGKDRRTLFSVEGSQEVSVTENLMELERLHPNLLVIVMPADKGFMQHDLMFERTPSESSGDAFKRMLDVVVGESRAKIQDFHLSDKATKLIFGDKKK